MRTLLLYIILFLPSLSIVSASEQFELQLKNLEKQYQAAKVEKKMIERSVKNINQRGKVLGHIGKINHLYYLKAKSSGKKNGFSSAMKKAQQVLIADQFYKILKEQRLNNYLSFLTFFLIFGVAVVYIIYTQTKSVLKKPGNPIF